MKLDVDRLRRAMLDGGVTQSELARRSGVSRATVARALSGRAGSVQARTAERLAAALGLPAATLDRDAVGTAYLRLVAEQHELLDLTGLGVVRLGEPLPIDRGYVPLRVREWRGRDDHAAPVRRLAGRDGRSRGVPLSRALARSRRLCLLGDPGSGKTTALRYLARRRALGGQAEHGGSSEQLVPVFVRLGEWGEQLRAGEDMDLVEAALAQSAVGDPGETGAWLRAQIEADKALLLLDGLDEVADPEAQRRVVEELRGFTAAHPEVPMVISSRVVGFEAPALGAGLDTFVVEPLDLEGARRLAEEWCAFRHGHRAGRECAACARRVAELRHAIADHRRIRALAGSPMILTILLLLHEAGTALPQRRWELYQRIVETFLFSWERKKRSALAGAPDRALKVDDRELLWLLESLALAMQKHDRTLVSRWWLTEHVRSFLRDDLAFEATDARAEADALIWSLQERSGLLVERGPQRFGLSHLAFQEHLAARAILGEARPAEALQPWLYHPRWREVVRLAVAQLDRHSVPKALRMILDDPDPAGRFLHRGLLVAVGCLADGAAVHDRALLAQISHEVVSLGRSKWLGIAFDALGPLSELLGTRLEQDARRALQGLIEEAKPVLTPDDLFWLCLEARATRLLGASDAEADAFLGGTSRPVLARHVTVLGEEGTVILVSEPDSHDAAWVDELVAQLAEDPSPAVRAICAAELGRFARRSRVRKGLVLALGREKRASVRERIAEALSAVAGQRAVLQTLVQRMQSDPEPSVRGACAAALAAVAPRRREVREQLVAVLTGPEPSLVRVGAARGLSRCHDTFRGARDALWAALEDDREDDHVRAACLRSLAEALPSDPRGAGHTMRLACGQAHAGPMLKRTAAQLLAQWLAAGRVPWDTARALRTEQVLMAVAQPCQHALDALRALVGARETRRLGVPREARIRRALAAFSDRIRAMFIFGSSARGEQGADSDVDLMVMGDVSLRELTPGLRRLEQELGRQVNVVILSEQEWRTRLTQGDPFVSSVQAGDKIFVAGGADELAAMAGQ